MSDLRPTAWLPDLVFTGGQFRTGLALISDESARLTVTDSTDNLKQSIRLRNRAVLPGLVNTHSHAFQRVIRGRTEYRTTNSKDSFWTWREMMYSAANRLTPEDIYDASRMAFLEMALGGITTVGEFHYLHNAPGGSPYHDPNLLAKEVVRAAQDVGLRIVLLRVAYARSGYQTKSNPQQARFIEASPDAYLQHVAQLKTAFAGLDGVLVGLAPHSVRALPLDYLQRVIRFGDEEQLSVHMHVAEQPAEVLSCIEEHGQPPVLLLQKEGLLSKRFTAVHAIHLGLDEVAVLAASGASVCVCPTTERNLGDGVVPVDSFFASGIPVSLGTDSHVQIDLLEDARELEYHLRLQKMERSILAPTGGSRSSLAERLFDSATVRGAASLGMRGGRFEPDYPADFFTVDLDDPSIAGSLTPDLLTGIVFSLSRTAVKEVVVGGKMIVDDGRHKDAEEIKDRFKAVQMRLWGNN